jgi:anoctamin-10
MAFFSNIFEIQVNKFRLTKLLRRPIPAGAGTIGAWLDIIDIISFMAIFSNAGTNIIFQIFQIKLSMWQVLFIGNIR